MQPPGGMKQRAEDNMKANPKGEKSDEKSAQENNMNNMKSDQPKGTSAQTEEKGSAGKDMKAEDRNGNMNAESKGAAESKSQTVGQAGAGAKALERAAHQDQHRDPETSTFSR